MNDDEVNANETPAGDGPADEAALRKALHENDPVVEVPLDDAVLTDIRSRADRRRTFKKVIISASSAAVIALLFGSIALARNGATDARVDTAAPPPSAAALPGGAEPGGPSVGSIPDPTVSPSTVDPTSTAVPAPDTTLSVPTSAATTSTGQPPTITPTTPSVPMPPCVRSSGPGMPPRAPMTIVGNPPEQATGTATIRGRYLGFEGTPVTITLTSLSDFGFEFQTAADGSFEISVPAGCQTRYNLEGPKWPANPNACGGYTIIVYDGDTLPLRDWGCQDFGPPGETTIPVTTIP